MIRLQLLGVFKIYKPDWYILIFILFAYLAGYYEKMMELVTRDLAWSPATPHTIHLSSG